MKLILASASPRRKELLHQIGLEFQICPAVGEERITKTSPSDTVMKLAEQKATEIFQNYIKEETNLCVIGADTVVAAENSILGKPTDKENAKAMLAMLQGNAHQVYTGVCLCWKKGEKTEKFCFYEKTDVIFYPMSEDEIEAYVESGDPMDKAGAYGIQGQCAAFIQGIKGDYNNVVGLPVGRLYQEMKKHQIL